MYGRDEGVPQWLITMMVEWNSCVQSCIMNLNSSFGPQQGSMLILCFHVLLHRSIWFSHCVKENMGPDGPRLLCLLQQVSLAPWTKQPDRTNARVGLGLDCHLMLSCFLYSSSYLNKLDKPSASTHSVGQLTNRN